MPLLAQRRRDAVACCASRHAARLLLGQFHTRMTAPPPRHFIGQSGAANTGQR